MTVAIGVTTYLEPVVMGLWNRPGSMLPRVYSDCLISAGAAVITLPPQPPTAETIARVLDSVDGLMLTGAKMLTPRSMGKNHTPRTTRHAPTATRGKSPSFAPPSSATCRCWASVAGCRCSTLRSAAR